MFEELGTGAKLAALLNKVEEIAVFALFEHQDRLVGFCLAALTPDCKLVAVVLGDVAWDLHGHTLGCMAMHL